MGGHVTNPFTGPGLCHSMQLVVVAPQALLGDVTLVCSIVDANSCDRQRRDANPLEPSEEGASRGVLVAPHGELCTGNRQHEQEFAVQKVSGHERGAGGALVDEPQWC